MAENRQINQAKPLVISTYLIRCCGGVILTLGTLKLLGTFTPTDEMRTYVGLSNPIFTFVSNGFVFIIAALIEIAVGWFCLTSKSIISGASILLVLCFSLIFYKIALIFVKYEGPCGCLFGINRFIPISTSKQRLIADIISIAILLVSITVLFYARIDSKRHSEVVPQ